MWLPPWDKIKTADKNTARLMEFNRLNYIIIYLKNQSNPHRPNTAQFNHRLYFAHNFRQFCKNSRKNNRESELAIYCHYEDTRRLHWQPSEFNSIKQGFHPTTSRNIPTPAKVYMAPFIANFWNCISDILYYLVKSGNHLVIIWKKFRHD